MTLLMTPTDEPVVTEETRFWLWTELEVIHYTWDTHRRVNVKSTRFWRGEVEVSEVAYRAAYAKFIGHASDITVPLDDHWWATSYVAGDASSRGWEIRRARGGRIDWWGS